MQENEEKIFVFYGAYIVICLYIISGFCSLLYGRQACKQIWSVSFL